MGVGHTVAYITLLDLQQPPVQLGQLLLDGGNKRLPVGRLFGGARGGADAVEAGALRRKPLQHGRETALRGVAQREARLQLLLVDPDGAVVAAAIAAAVAAAIAAAIAGLAAFAQQRAWVAEQHKHHLAHRLQFRHQPEWVHCCVSAVTRHMQRMGC